MTTCILPKLAFPSSSPDELPPNRIVQLPHPRTNCPARFLIYHPASNNSTSEEDSKENVKIAQLLKLSSDSLHSLLFSDYIIQDGSIIFFAPIDPLFFLIATLYTSSSTSFQSLDDVLYSTTYPALSCLSNIPEIRDRAVLVCDEKCFGGDLKVFKLNHQKTVSFLKKKVDKLIKHLHSSPSNSLTEEEMKRNALQIIADYVPQGLVDVLASELKCDVSDENNLEINYFNHARANTDVKPKEEKAVKKAKLTATQRKLESADKSGMKSITSFFQKKTK